MVTEKSAPSETSDKVPEAKPEVEKLTAIEKQLQILSDRVNKQESVISKKDAENRQLREKLESHDEQVALNQAMLGYLSRKEGRSIEDLETDVKSDKIDLVGEYKRAVKETQEARKKEEFNKGISEIQGRIASLGYTENDPEYWEVFGRVAGRNLDDAYRRVEQLPDKKAVKPVVKEEPVDIEKQVEEKARKLLEERGQLKTEVTPPSGGGKGKVFSKSEIDNWDWREYKKNFPTYEDFLNAMNEGRIKE